MLAKHRIKLMRDRIGQTDEKSNQLEAHEIEQLDEKSNQPDGRETELNARGIDSGRRTRNRVAEPDAQTHRYTWTLTT